MPESPSKAASPSGAAPATTAEAATPVPIDVPNDPTLMDKVVNLSKRRGFVFPSAEIYGGFRSTYDYGPIGVLLLRNVKDAWWRSMVQLRDDVVGLDAAILSPPAVWEASGHLANFTDPLVDCRNCRERFRLRICRRSSTQHPKYSKHRCRRHRRTESRGSRMDGRSLQAIDLELVP
jgi:glycyl-tRNA synthetase (class II)